MRAVQVSTATLASLCLAACGGSQKPANPYLADLDKRVRSVDIVGNQALSDKEIIAGLATHGPSGWLTSKYAPYDPAALHADTKRIETFYRQHGYYLARVKEIETKEVGSDFVDVKVYVEEGSPATLAAYAFTWQATTAPSAVDDAALEAKAKLETGVAFRHPEYLAAKERLRRFLVGEGYAHAEVGGVVKVDRDAGTVQVEFLLDPGPQVTFGEIIITGNRRTPDSVIENRITFARGDRFDLAELDRTQARLYQLGLFASVQVDYEHDGKPAVTDVKISVFEGTRHELRLGMGAAVDQVHFEVRTRAEYVHRAPLIDPKMTFRLELRPAYQWLRTDANTGGFGGEARARVERLDLFWAELLGAAEVSYLSIELESYSARGPRGQLGLFRPFLEGRLQVGATWNIEALSFPEVDPAILEDPMLAEELGVIGDYRLAFYEQIVSLDLRDQLLDPHEGVYAEVRLEEATPLAGSLDTYTKASGEVRGYYSVGKRLVAAARLRHARVLRGEDDLPITRRYFSGGASSHRGFAQRRLTPTVVGDESMTTAYIGGDALLESNWELRYDVVMIKKNWLGIVVFADGGDVTMDPGRIELGKLHWAPGIGLRYNTLVGPVRADVGYRVTRVNGENDPAPGDTWAFHFSIGEAF